MNFRASTQNVGAIVNLFLFASCDQQLSNSVDEARRARIDADIPTIGFALSIYERNSQSLPTTEQGLKALVERPESDPPPGNWIQYLQAIPQDPWDQEYQYRYQPAQDGLSGKIFNLWSMGPDGKSGTDDDRGNW